jgi:hypothetical protein
MDDGTSVLANVPRFETGKGLTVEEGTTNLLTAQQAGLPAAGTAGFVGNSGPETLSRDIGAGYRIMGSAALKVITPGTIPGEGVASGVALTVTIPNNTYTLSGYFCGAGNIKLGLVEYQDGVGAVGTTWCSINPIALTATSTRYSVSRTFGATGNRAYLLILTTAAAAITFYVSGLQIEQKAYATSWIDGAATRNAEVVTVPTAGVLSPSQGTVEMLVNVTDTLKSTAAVNRLFDCTGTDATHNRFRLQHYTDNTFSIMSWNNAGASSSVGVSTAGYALGKHRFAIKWSAAELAFFIDGVEVGAHVDNPSIPSSLGANMYIGSTFDGTYQADAQISDVVISSRARTDTELDAQHRGVLTPLGCDKDTTWYAPLTSSVAHQCPSTGATRILDRSGFGNHATNYGSTVVAGPNGAVRKCAGKEYMTCNSSVPDLIGDKFTISAWMKPTSTPILNKVWLSANSYNNDGWYFWLYGTQAGIHANKIAASFAWSGGTSSEMFTNAPALSLNTLYHVVITVDADALKSYLYINGVYIGSVTMGQRMVKPVNRTMYIGRYVGADYEAFVEFNSLTAFNHTLSSAEVKQLYENTRWMYQ